MLVSCPDIGKGGTCYESSFDIAQSRGSLAAKGVKQAEP